ncbi:MAG: hypothetical protein AB9869_28405 [Verrucomicrobiia bacterium]
MHASEPNYLREFVKSPHHFWLGLLTVGSGFLLAHPLALIVGTTAYALGWIYLPDMALFKNWVNRRSEAERRAAALVQVEEFLKRREALLVALAPTRRTRYMELAGVCRDIEAATSDSQLAPRESTTDPRLKKLDELMWTYLRLLGIEESLERFLETERREELPLVVQEAEGEIELLNQEIEGLKAKGPVSSLDAKQRLLGSRLERLEVLRKRVERVNTAGNNLALVRSEQERLVEQIKLVRADAVAAKNAETLTARIDATVEHLDQTNKWISEMDDFKDLVGDMPATDFRIGYGTMPVSSARTPAPPRIERRAAREQH